MNQPHQFAFDVADLLDPGEDVRPGQFVGVWHGKRQRGILTVVQVANAREINPNEVPELAAARQRLGLPSGYAQEGSPLESSEC